MPAIKSAKRVSPWCVRTKPDFTLIIYGGDAKPYLELRPEYRHGLGSTLDIYRVSGPESAWLATLHVNVFPNLIRALPTATNAALRMAAKAAKKSSN